MAEIKWYGHACFRLRAREATVIMDPVPRSFGYRMDRLRPQIVTISHHHKGHDAVDALSGDFNVIDGPGEYEISDVFITGIQTYHDNVRGAEHGKNTVYLIEAEGLTICHLGDLGHELTDDQVSAMSFVDVLLVPVGGGTVLDAARASSVVGQIEPRIVIPMQYRTDQGDHDRDGVEAFLHEMAVQEIEPEEKLVIRPSDTQESTELVVLTCSAAAS